LIGTKYEEHLHDKNLLNDLTRFSEDFDGGRLCHLDLGLHNMFGTEKPTIFDGIYNSHLPLFDLAITNLWNIYLGKEFIAKINNIYSENVDFKFDQDDLSSFLKYAAIYKLNKWVVRSKSEPKVKKWIKNAEIYLNN
jgi:hypothetical protein